MGPVSGQNALCDTIKPCLDVWKNANEDVQHAYRFVEFLRVMAV
jgi:hypothetical protein